MAMTLSRKQVWLALSPRLTEGLAAQVCTPVRDVLATYTPRQTDLVLLSRQVEDCLFRRLYELLGVRMAFRQPDGRVDRIRTDELPDLADAAMGVLLEALRVSPANFDLIKSYAMQTGSLSALRLLTGPYASCQTEAEVALLRRILDERSH